MLSILKTFIVIGVVSSLVACTGGGDEETPKTGPTGPTTGTARITAISGGIYSKVANLDSLIIETAVIKNELEEVVADGYSFDISAEENGLTFSKINEEVYLPTISVESLEGKVKFKTKLPTTAGVYRVKVKDSKSITTGRFTVNVNSGPVASLGDIKTTRYEDLPPYNGVKDENENYSLIADGLSTTYISVGPIVDNYGNLVSTANIRMTHSAGEMISENPATVSEGIAYFRMQSEDTPQLVNLIVDALDSTGSPIVSKNGAIEFVRGRITIADSGDLGNVYLGQEVTKSFLVVNDGTREITNVTYSIDSPFSMLSSSTCLGKNKLRVQESCTINVKFSSAIRGLYQGNLRILGSPLNVPGSSLVFPLQAFAVMPADLRLSRGEIDFGEQKCGNVYQEEFYVENVGDENATNVVMINPPPYSGQSSSFFQLISPPLDEPMNPDVTVPVNCGNTFFHGRKCRVVLRFQPQALVLSTALIGHITATGFDIPVTARGQSKLGDPFGTIPVSLNTEEERLAGQQMAQDNMLLNTSSLTDKYSEVNIGPVRDKCNNIVNVATVQVTASRGSLDSATVITNNGVGSTLWRTSSNINSLGSQSVSVVIKDTLGATIATGSKAAIFRGINLQLSGVTNLGQILTKKPRIEFYTLKNLGNITAQNLFSEVTPSGTSWYTLDNTYQGGCHDGILEAGAECLLKLTFNTDLNFSTATNNVGNISANFKMSSLERGTNTTNINITGRSEQPPVLSFSPNPYDFGNPAVVAGTPAQGSITLSNAGPATAYNLAFVVDNPFIIDAATTTCSTELVGSASCVVGLKMTQSTKGPYPGTIKVTAEFNQPIGYAAQANISTQIAANLASGVIPITFDKATVPADKASKIIMTIGPIRDAFNNVVNTGTQVKVSSNAGKLGGDGDGDNIIFLTTNSMGYVTADIVSADFSEIRTFLITAEVLNGASVIASGTKSGSFTGAKLEFIGESFDFGLTTAGGAKVQQIKLKNNGNETSTGITVGSSNSNVFPISSACSSLTPNQECTITIIFQPPEALTYSGVLTANGSGRGVLTDSYNIAGTGVLPANLIITQPSSKTLVIGLVPGVSSAGSFSVTNTGNELINSFVVSSDLRNSEFTFNRGSNCNSLGYNQMCVTNFTFTPSSQVSGNVNVTLTAHGESATRTTDDFLTLSFVPSIIQITAPEDQVKGACGELRIGLRDGDANPVVAPQNLTYSLSKVGPAGNFYNNSNCVGGTISTIGIAQGSSNSNLFYYKGTQSGTHEINVSSGSAYNYKVNIQIYDTLAATPEPAKILPGGMSTISVTGGTQPYSFNVVGGNSNGTLNTGIFFPTYTEYTAPNTVGIYQVRVRDSRLFGGGPIEIFANIEVVPEFVSCVAEINNSATATKTFSVINQSYGSCILGTCGSGYSAYNNQCYVSSISCTPSELSSIHAQASAGTKSFNGSGGYNSCQLTQCNTNYYANNNTCLPTQQMVDLNQILVNKCEVASLNMTFYFSSQVTCQAVKNYSWISGTVSCGGYSTSSSCNATPGCGWFPGTPGNCAQLYSDICYDSTMGNYMYDIAQADCYPRPGIWSQGPATNDSSPRNFFPASNGLVYFMATDLSSSYGLFRSDGTLPGTFKIATTTDPNSFQFFAEFGGKVYFNNYDATYGMELWESDGTIAGTKLSKDFNTGSGSSNPAPHATSSYLYAMTRNSAATATAGIYYTTTPNTASSWAVVASSTTLNPNFISYPGKKNVLATKDNLYVMGTIASGAEIYRVSGSTLSLVVEYASGASNSLGGVSEFIPYDYSTNSILVLATTSGSNTNFYAIDNTTSRTLSTLNSTTHNPNLLPYGPENRFKTSTGRFYITACVTTTTNCEIKLVPSTGTTLTTIVSGVGSSSTKFFGEVGGKVIFAYQNATYGMELYSMNLDGSSPTLIQDLNVGAGSSVFGAVSTTLAYNYTGQLKPVVMGGYLYLGINSRLYKTNGTTLSEVLLPETLPINMTSYLLWPAGSAADKILINYNAGIYGNPELYLLRP